MTAVIPASAPAHVCLLAAVSHPQVRPSKAADPINDRHWAQRNLLAVAAAPAAPAITPFTVANPHVEPELMQLRAGVVDPLRARAAPGAFGTTASDVPVTVRLLDTQGAAVTSDGPTVATGLHLDGLAHRDFQLFIEVNDDIPPGTSVGVEILLITHDGEGDIVGSLGIAVIADDPI